MLALWGYWRDLDGDYSSNQLFLASAIAIVVATTPVSYTHLTLPTTPYV